MRTVRRPFQGAEHAVRGHRGFRALAAAVVTLLAIGLVPGTGRAQPVETLTLDSSRMEACCTPGAEWVVVGTTGDCVPGTGRVGLDPSYDWDALGGENGHSGAGVVVPVPDGAFTVTVPVPDELTEDWTHWHGCEIRSNDRNIWMGGYGGVQVLGPPASEPDDDPTPDPDPTADPGDVASERRENAPPRAVPDRYTVAPGESLDVPAPGITGNDEDPEGGVLLVYALAARSDLQGTLRVRPDGGVVFQPSGDGPGALCFEYLVRDEGRAFSEPVGVVVVVGDAAPDALVDGDRCATESSQDEAEFDVELSDEPLEEQVVDLATGRAPVVGVEPVLAMPLGPLAHGHLGAPPYNWFWDLVPACDDAPTRKPQSSGYWYGSIRQRVGAYAEGADYVRFRTRHFRNNQLVTTHPWRYRQTSQMTPAGRAFFISRIRMGHPSTLYEVEFQIQWWDDRFTPNVWWGEPVKKFVKGRWRDRLLADSGWFYPGGGCRSGSAYGL